MPALIASARRHKNSKLITALSVITILLLLTIPPAALLIWVGLMGYALFGQRNLDTYPKSAQSSPTTEKSDVNSLNALSASPIPGTQTTIQQSESPRSLDPPKEPAKQEQQSQSTEPPLKAPGGFDPLAHQTLPETDEKKVNGAYQEPSRTSSWSAKAVKKRSALERRFLQILEVGEVVLAVASTNRVRGPRVNFVVATNIRVLALHDDERLNSKFEWAFWSDLRQIEYTDRGLSPFGLTCLLHDGQAIPMGNLSKNDNAEEFLKYASELTLNPPDRDAEAVLRSRISSFQSQIRHVEVISPIPQPNEAQNPQAQVPGQTQGANSSSEHGAFSYLFKWRKQIRNTKADFVRTASQYTLLLHAKRRHVSLTASIDEALFLSDSDQNIFESHGCALIEVRKGARVTHRESTYSGSSRSASVRVGRVRVGGGSHGGSSSSTSISYPAPDELTQIDRGTAFVTPHRVSFSGSKFTKTTDFKKMVEVRTKGRQLLIAPKTGSKVWIIEFPTPEEGWIFGALVDTAFNTPQRCLNDKSESIYGSVFDEIQAYFRRTEADIDAKVRDYVDELAMLQDKWSNYQLMFPKRVGKLEMPRLAPLPKEAADTKASVLLLSKPNNFSDALELMKLIRTHTSLSLAEVKKIVESAPSVVLPSVDSELAEALVHTLSDAGADVIASYAR